MPNPLAKTEIQLRYLCDFICANSSIISSSPTIGERNIPLLLRHTDRLNNIEEYHLFPPLSAIPTAFHEKKQKSD
jgi:hypothetical protein